MLKVNFTPSHTHRVILSHFFTLMMLDIRRYVTLPDAPSVHLSYYSGKRDEFTHACTLKVLTVASCLQRHKRTYAQGNEDEVEEEESKVWIWTPPTPDQLFSPQHSVTLQFRQPHISRTDVIYQGTSLQQSTNLCTLLDSPLSEPQLWGWYSQPVKFRGYAITEVQWEKKKSTLRIWRETRRAQIFNNLYSPKCKCVNSTCITLVKLLLLLQYKLNFLLKIQH